MKHQHLITDIELWKRGRWKRPLYLYGKSFSV